MKRWAILAVGLILGFMLLGLPHEYCMDGTGYGFPFSGYHPGHGEWGELAVTPEEKFSNVVDLPNLAASVAMWSAVLGFLFWNQRRRRAGATTAGSLRGGTHPGSD